MASRGEETHTAARSKQDGIDISDPIVKKYLHGNAPNLKSIRDRRLKGRLVAREQLNGSSAKIAAKAEKWLMPAEEGYLEADGLEKTWRIKQESIVQEVDLISSKKPFDMILPELGPYSLDYTLSGRYMIIGGRKGHLAMMDMLNMELIKEFQVRETVRDAVFLHNDQFFAAAQKKYLYIYNRHGTEIHCLQEHGAPLKLQFLEKHFLIVSINKYGHLHYQDTSTGQMVTDYRTALGPTDVMRANPYNALIGLGHSGGRVTMWMPTSGKPLLTLLSHHGPVTALAFHNNGYLMASAGMDRKIKLWDIRKLQPFHEYSGFATTLDFSKRGLLASGNVSQINIRRDSVGNQDYTPYMSHHMIKGYQVKKVVFRPYEDVLGIGHSMGLSAILVPGAGEPNFDTWVANPYETAKQRREKEVHALVDKLPPHTIMLEPSWLGKVNEPVPAKKDKPTEKEREEAMETAIETAKNVSFKNKTKGRSKPSKKAKRKQEEVFKAKRPFLEKEANEVHAKKKLRTEVTTDLPKSLQRFARKNDL